MKTLKKIYYIINKEDKKSLFYLLLINISVFIFEFLSIISIPIFTSVLLNTTSVFEKYSLFQSNFVKENFLLLASLFVVLTFILKNLFLLYGKYISHAFLRKLKIYLSTKIFNFYFESSLLNTYKLKPSTMYRNVINEMVGIEAFLINLNKFILEISASLIIFAILLFLNFKVSFSLILIFSSLTFFYLRFVRPTLKRKARENQAFIANFNKLILETFESIKDIKIFQKEQAVSKIFKKDVTAFENNIFYFKIFDTLPKILLEVISILIILLITLIVFLKSAQANNFIEYFPVLSLIIVSCIRLIPAFNGINVSLFYLRVHARSLDVISKQLQDIKKEKETLNDKEKNLKINFKKDLDNEKNFLVIDNVSFSYEQDKEVLKNINLAIPKKSKVAIIGKTGSGKSTLQHIIMGLIKPRQGNIFFKNQNIELLNDKWLSKISFVSQKIFLLDETIKKNICLNFDGENIDQDKLNRAIKIAELPDQMISTNEKISKQIGTDGISLSGGERQRLAIARAVYKSSEILFLDEFTSSLDNQTQEKIIKNLKDYLPDTTIIMISHRQEITRHCDKVINLDD